MGKVIEDVSYTHLDVYKRQQKHLDIKTSISVQMDREETIILTHGQKLTDEYMIRFLQKPKATAETMVSDMECILCLRSQEKNLPEQ